MKDLMGLMKQAKEMQKNMAAAQAQVADIVVEGRSGGGLVTVELAGGGTMKSLKILLPCINHSAHQKGKFIPGGRGISPIASFIVFACASSSFTFAS